VVIECRSGTRSLKHFQSGVGGGASPPKYKQWIQAVQGLLTPVSSL
jgi:hypothetical protein